MKKLFKITATVACLFLITSSYSQNFSLTNDWNKLPNSPNKIVDSKASNDGIYYLENGVTLVPYFEDSLHLDTLHGTKDSSVYLKKISFAGELIWSLEFQRDHYPFFNGTIGVPGKINILDDCIVLFHDYGVSRVSFDGELIFEKILPQTSFDSTDFFGCSQNPDYFYDAIYQIKKDTICLLGHISHCGSYACVDSTYIFQIMNSQTGEIVDSLKINREVKLHFIQDEVDPMLFYFAYIKKDGSNRRINFIDSVSLRHKQANNIGQDANYHWEELLYFSKNGDYFPMVTSSYDSIGKASYIHLPFWTWMYGDAFLSIKWAHKQEFDHIMHCLDQFVSCKPMANSTLYYITTEDGELIQRDIKNGDQNEMNKINPLVDGERCFGSPRICIVGDKVVYATTDSVDAGDNYIGTVVLRVFDREFNLLSKDFLKGLHLAEIVSIDSNSFCFYGYAGQEKPRILSHWTLNQITNIKNIQNSDLDFNVYPNPFISTLNVKTEKSCNIVIYNVNGTKVFERNVQKGTKFDLSFLSPGIYFIKSSNGESKKIIKQ